MNLQTTISIHAGGPGSGRRPGDVAKRAGYIKTRVSEARGTGTTMYLHPNGDHVVVDRNDNWSHATKDSKVKHGVRYTEGRGGDSLQRHLTKKINAGGPGSGRRPSGNSKSGPHAALIDAGYKKVGGYKGEQEISGQYEKRDPKTGVRDTITLYKEGGYTHTRTKPEGGQRETPFHVTQNTSLENFLRRK